MLFLVIKYCGLSGKNNNVNKYVSGKDERIHDTWSYEKKLPSKKANKIPILQDKTRNVPSFPLTL